MKKFAVIALTFVLIASMFAGCRRNVTPETSEPTKATTPATQPTTQATKPATTPTTPTSTTATSGNDGKMGDGKIDGYGDAGRGRRSSNMP